MASSEQPLKKRRLYEPPPESPPPQPQQEKQKQSPETVSEPVSSTVAPPQTPSQLSHDEFLTRRRNRDEIRIVYDTYKRLKVCVSQSEKRQVAELEQIFYSLIAASRGCISAQRILADLIPRYISHCPTALEAAAKVVVEMHNSSLQVIKRGEDFDGIALETARECIFGLADICCTASSEASRSSVIRSICLAVFQNVFSFFMTSFEGNDFFHFADKEILKIQDSADIFSVLKQKFSNEDASSLVKLFKLRVLCLFRILFSCPKNVLRAYFNLFNATNPEGSTEGQYFLIQVTSRLVQMPHNLDKANDEPMSHKDPDRTAGFNEFTGEELLSDHNHVSGDTPSVSGNCLLKLVLGKDVSLRTWMYLKYKKLCSLPSIKIAPDVRSALEGIFGQFEELSNLEDIAMDSEEDDSDPSNFANRQYSMPGISNQHEMSAELHRQGATNGVLGLRSMDVETSNVADSSHSWSSTPRDVLNQQMLSPATRTPLDYRSNSFDGRNRSVHVDKNSVSNNSPAMPSFGGNSSSAFASPRHPSYAAATQTIWFCDGDPAAMDIFSASRQLWLGSLGPDISEGHIRYQLERFAPVDRFFFFPVKGFALVEYRTIMDAIRAREYVRSHFPWLIKFMDIGLGTRGAMNGISIGSSCHVFVGSISSQWARDEILHESRKVSYRGPYMVNDLFSEGALLMEFETPEEAAAVMMHLRQFRKEKINHMPPLNAGLSATAMPQLDAARSVPNSVHPDVRSSNPGIMCNTVTESPNAPTVPQSPTDSSRTRMSHLSSLLASLRSKYNINQNANYFENLIPGSSHSATARDVDQVPSNTLWICLPNASSPVLTDDELMAVCNLGVANIGSAVRLTRSNTQMGCGWFVECNSVETANALLKSLRNCPGMFLLIEFSQQGNNFAPPSLMPDGSSVELVSPSVNSENQSTTVQAPSSFGMMKSSQGGGHVATMDQMWMYNKSENEMQSAPGSIPCMPPGSQGPIPPPQQFQPSPYLRPVFPPPNSSWDPRGLNHHATVNPVPPLVLPNSFQSSAVASPCMPALVTPLVQMQRPPMQHFDHMFSLPVVPHPSTAMPPQPEIPPPLPSSPPPAPPPSSPPPPPPPPVAESTELACSVQSNQYQWQGKLSKSGVHYCKVYANRLDSDICKYSSAMSEPAEWPAKLDMTKRTDFRHVKSTFSNTPPHKREVCRLIPSTASDQKGFQDFITYLKQRECAGVIKIPAMNSIWSRLLFIMTYSEETCSLLSIPLDTSIGLIALVLPKETNFEWV